MKHPLLLIAVVLTGCAAHGPSSATAPTFIGDYGIWLERHIAAMEASAPAEWPKFRIGADTRSAHGGETFSVACAYLIRRDPTLFLRRHLTGDRYGILCGRRAYGWSSQDYRLVLDAVYRYRLVEAKTKTERQKIEEFIAETTKKTNKAMQRGRRGCERDEFAALP
jgi:hypothetical protein